MGVRTIDLASAVQMPWKNGNGSTIELAIAPAGANLDNFAWRISSACVGGHGSFSNFPGIDRSLAILGGAGLRLNTPTEPSLQLTTDSQPWLFRGETTVYAELLEGAVTDLNIMSRREQWTHRLEAVQVNGEYRLDTSTPASVLMIYCHTASQLNCTLSGGEHLVLHAQQGLLIDAADTLQTITLSAKTPSCVYIAQLYQR